jgi:hypothetical protein
VACIRARVEKDPALKQALAARHKAAAEAGRTAPAHGSRFAMAAAGTAILAAVYLQYAFLGQAP